MSQAKRQQIKNEHWVFFVFVLLSKEPKKHFQRNPEIMHQHFQMVVVVVVVVVIKREYKLHASTSEATPMFCRTAGKVWKEHPLLKTEMHLTASWRKAEANTRHSHGVP